MLFQETVYAISIVLEKHTTSSATAQRQRASAVVIRCLVSFKLIDVGTNRNSKARMRLLISNVGPCVFYFLNHTQLMYSNACFRGRRIQICYIKFQGSQGSCHGNQIWAKISQNCTDFSSLQKIQEFFACIVGFSGLVNLSMLSEFCMMITGENN